MVAAFILAPLVMALLLACAMPLYQGVPSLADRIVRTLPWYLIVGGYGPTVLFGIPLYFILRKHVAPTLVACALAGLCVIMAPWLLMVFTSAVEHQVIGQQVIISEGQLTSAGWAFFAKGMASIAAIGLGTGTIFGLIAVAGSPRPAALEKGTA